ncbi:uncharacterized protein FOMMEDRAFT_30438 [Fomitiporia mediterranea MF3/22]|uniref:uncharacterized protein n=1 Tax=Fomitiporia mediterranea (strain MF3/22) TaxID=694068 RepID=UPI00044080A5|nr:uncharacterized protein FOMMEDRAFT_30438 [Fomitiporia mediterranea MF3/22]EJD00366.1 hypothetical protein FOMMEDRAFT_30438 [Fomitiporia mediterranea MF3/22]
MYRSVTRRAEGRNITRGALPLGKTAADHETTGAGDPSPTTQTHCTERSEKASRKSRPLSGSTNKQIISETRNIDSSTLSSAQSQWKMGRSVTPGLITDENDDWILNQQAPAMPLLNERPPMARCRTSSSGGSKSKRKVEEKKSARSSFHQDDPVVAGIVQSGDDDQVRITRARSHSASQDKAPSLKRRLSWSRKKSKQEVPQEEEPDYKKRASQLGLPDIEKDLVPSLHDTVHKMTDNHQISNYVSKQSGRKAGFPSTMLAGLLSPPIVNERAASPIPFRHTASSPVESASLISRRQSRSPRMEAYDEGSDAFDHDLDMRTKVSKNGSAENNNQKFPGSEYDHVISEPKSKSALKTALRTPRSYKKIQTRSLAMETDDSSSSEPILRTPRVRSSRKHASPLLSTSPVQMVSSIPSPNFMSRSSSSASRPDKSPSLSHSSEHKSPRLPSSLRSPLLSAGQVDMTSRRSRSPNHMDRMGGPARLQASNSPVANQNEDVEGTPKASRIAWSRRYQNTTETESSADERLRIPNQLSNASRVRSVSARTSPNPDYDKSRLGSRMSVVQKQPATVITEQSASEFSEQEPMPSDKASEDSRVRRNNELVDLVAGLNLDLGHRKDSPVSVTRRKIASSTGHSAKGKANSVNQSSDSAQQVAIGIALGASNGRASSRANSPALNEDKVSHDRDDYLAVPVPHEQGRPARCSSTSRRRSSTPRQDATEASTDANQANNFLKPEPKAANRDSLLMLNADRQREAFGIPPSLSRVHESNETLSSEESNSSLKNHTIDSDWEHEASDGLGLSHGAERLFHALGIGAGAQHGEDHQHARGHRASRRSSMAGAEKFLAEFVCSPRAPMSASSSCSSIYEDDVPDRPWQKRERDLNRVQSGSGAGGSNSDVKSSWKRSLPHSAYASLLERHGEVEMRRQEVIWELCETELVFLRSLRTALKVFVSPLLGKNRTWVSGVPSNVSRLLDWLEDIYQLHAKISSALQHTRSSQYPVVLRIAETLRAFVPKLEVYQPYIVRLDEILGDIEAMMKDPKDEVGEFFRLQSSAEECAGTSFASFLWLPLMRLGKYLKYFNELWDLTPRSHVDHLPTFSLLHSATIVVRVMREVKLREEEHAYVKELVSRIRGLPNAMQLMRRERRLVAHGALQRVHFSERTKDALEGNSSFKPGGRHARHVRYEEEQRSTVRRRRANSLDSCLSEGTSMGSLSSAASNSSLNGEVAHHPHARGKPSKTTELYAFIFTDLAIFATPTSHRTHRVHSGKVQNDLELLDDIGICRILSVTDHSGDLEYDNLIGLHILPMDADRLDKGILSDTSATSLFVHIPNSRSSGSQPSDIRQRWWDAFERCYQSTLRSLSFPTHSGRYLTHGPGADQDENTKQTVMAILASGLPLPKSPSAQISEIEKNAAEDTALREREERGWWALRFQQTLHETQREESLRLQSQPQNKPYLPTGTGTKRKTISERRRLKLSSSGRN